MWVSRILPLATSLVLATSLALAQPCAAASAESPAPASLILKLRAEGPHAVRGCAEARTEAGLDLAGATADASTSLDVLRRRHAVQGVRAVFRRPDGFDSFDLRSQEEALRSRMRRARLRSPARAKRTRAPRSDPGSLAHVYRFELPRAADVQAAVAAFAADPHVEWAQPNYAVETDRLLDDPFLTSSGSWGQPFADLWGLSRVGAAEAWDQTLGEGSVVAVADTGVDLRHPDLVENLWVHPGEDLDGDGVADPEEWNGIDDDGNGFVDDIHGYDFHAVTRADEGDPDASDDLTDSDPTDRNGHGTHVSGTAAARGDNGIGIAGVAPRAKLMAVKVFPDRGSAETERVWRGVLYAAENGADVINASFSCNPRCASNPIAEEVVRLVRDLGVVFVTSAGNRGDDLRLTSPEKLRESITVGAGEPDDELASFSTFGLLMDVVAPGSQVLSLLLEDPVIWSPTRFVGEDYMRLSGTSMAAPHVAGVVALLLSANPGLDVDQVRALLRDTAEDDGPPGPDQRHGHGWVRVDQAIALGTPPDAFGSIDEPAAGAALPTQADRVEIRTRIWGRDVAAARLELGAGSRPESWELLGQPASGEASTTWDTSRLADDRYVLRLVLTTHGGDEIQEFAPIHLDRNVPAPVSPPGVRASKPDVAGARVAWIAPGTADTNGDPGLELYWGRFGREGARPLVTGSGDQNQPLLSRRAVTWHHRPAPGSTELGGLFGCAFRGGRSRCEPEHLGLLAASPSLSGSRVVYANGLIPPFDVLSCQLDGQGCNPQPVTPPVSASPIPLLSGDRLVWVDRPAGAFEFFTCRLAPAGEVCEPTAIGLESLFHLVPKALSGRVLAYEHVDSFSLTPEFRLSVCAIDESKGSCAPVQVDAGREQFEPDLSRGRLVWASRAAGDEPDVFVCRLDATTGSCPPQRITSHPARQSTPRIHHGRVVWLDDQEGDPRVVSLRLPTLAGLRKRKVEAGARIRFGLFETSGGEPVAFEGFTSSGEPVATLGVRISSNPAAGGIAKVRWQPGAAQVGVHQLRFRATRRSGLYDERTIRIVVTPPANESERGGRARPRPRLPAPR